MTTNTEDQDVWRARTWREWVGDVLPVVLWFGYAVAFVAWVAPEHVAVGWALGVFGCIAGAGGALGHVSMKHYHRLGDEELRAALEETMTAQELLRRAQSFHDDVVAELNRARKQAALAALDGASDRPRETLQ